jgi:hypothetical protein
LQPLSPPLTNSTPDLSIEHVLTANGFLIYRVIPHTNKFWTINITLDMGLPDYFYTNFSIFTVNASIRTTATIFNFINAPGGITNPQYQRFIDIGSLWNDEVRSDIKANGTFSLPFTWKVNLQTWVEYLNNTDGVHYFRVHGLDMQTHFVEIIFNSSLFASDTAQFTITVVPLQTNELDVSILSGVIPDTNQTKFGYITHLVFNWTIQDNNLTIFNPNLVILYDDQVLSELNYEIYGISVLTNTTNSTTHVWISFYKSSDLLLGYEIGMQKFEFRFSAFGMESQSHIFEVFTDGYDLDVTVIYKDKLIPGSDFTITVQLAYANESTFRVLNSTTSTLRLQIIPQNTLLGSPIEDLFEVEFNIYVEYKDGSREWLNSTGQTTGGESIFALTDTDNIAQILNINIGIPGGSDNARLVFDVDVDTLPLVEEIPGFPFEILFIAILITAIVITIVIFTMNRRRSGKQRKVRAAQQKLDDARDRLSLISDIYTILITSESGLPVYSIINSLYKNNPAISEIVSGLSVGIDSFLQSFQSDFMQQLGEQITNEKQIKVSTIQREEFQIMILGTLSYRIFAFLREKPPQFVVEIFRNIIGDLESSLKLDDLIDEKTVRPRAEHVMRKFFPLTLLSTFVIDPNRLKFVENESKKKKGKKLSQEAILSLKRLSLIRSGAMRNLKASPEDQGKEFDKLHKKGQLGEIGILHYDVAMNMLERTLNIPIETVLEALWEGSSSEFLVIIPFSEEVLPSGRRY